MTEDPTVSLKVDVLDGVLLCFIALGPWVENVKTAWETTPTKSFLIGMPLPCTKIQLAEVFQYDEVLDDIKEAFWKRLCQRVGVLCRCPFWFPR